MVRNKGRNLTVRDVDRIVEQLATFRVRTVNLGGNEPIFTSGLNPEDTILPYIIRSLHDAGIVVGFTTSGVTLNYIDQFCPNVLDLVNDVDISLDSPFAEEHNKNRGAQLFNHAIRALGICNERGISHTAVMCGMNWNLSDRHIDELVRLASEYRALVRINFMKPTKAEHMEMVPDVVSYYRAAARLLSRCQAVEMGESLVATAARVQHSGFPCGTKSFRIHSITPDGKVPVSPCVYAHDYKVGDLLKDDLNDIIHSLQFEAFRNRRERPETVDGCRDCRYIESCRGGCASRAYLTKKFMTGRIDLSSRDPYCLRDLENSGRARPNINDVEAFPESGIVLVHRDYLCTLIARPQCHV